MEVGEREEEEGEKKGEGGEGRRMGRREWERGKEQPC